METIADRLVAELVCEKVFALSEEIRYVALYRNGKLQSVSRPNRVSSGAWDFDKCEETIVNPTLITLLQQRGRIDSDWMRSVIIEYGRFTQVVQPIKEGHLSISFAPGCRYSRFLPRIHNLLNVQNLICDQ